MKTLAKVSFALLIGISAFGAPSVAVSQESRDAAIARCIKVAADAYPDGREGATTQRTAAYKACMTSAGQTP